MSPEETPDPKKDLYSSYTSTTRGQQTSPRKWPPTHYEHWRLIMNLLADMKLRTPSLREMLCKICCRHSVAEIHANPSYRMRVPAPATQAQTSQFENQDISCTHITFRIASRAQSDFILQKPRSSKSYGLLSVNNKHGRREHCNFVSCVDQAANHRSLLSSPSPPM